MMVTAMLYRMDTTVIWESSIPAREAEHNAPY